MSECCLLIIAEIIVLTSSCWQYFLTCFLLFVFIFQGIFVLSFFHWRPWKTLCVLPSNSSKIKHILCITSGRDSLVMFTRRCSISVMDSHSPTLNLTGFNTVSKISFHSCYLLSSAFQAGAFISSQYSNLHSEPRT